MLRRHLLRRTISFECVPLKTTAKLVLVAICDLQQGNLKCVDADGGSWLEVRRRTGARLFVRFPRIRRAIRESVLSVLIYSASVLFAGSARSGSQTSALATSRRRCSRTPSRPSTGPTSTRAPASGAARPSTRWTGSVR